MYCNICPPCIWLNGPPGPGLTKIGGGMMLVIAFIYYLKTENWNRNIPVLTCTRILIDQNLPQGDLYTLQSGLFLRDTSGSLLKYFMQYNLYRTDCEFSFSPPLSSMLLLCWRAIYDMINIAVLPGTHGLWHKRKNRRNRKHQRQVSNSCINVYIFYKISKWNTYEYNKSNVYIYTQQN